MLPQVFATPMMITAMENAALNAIRGYLEAGESAVGTAVDIRHLAATPVGHQVTAEAEVTGVDGRRIAFNVSARDEIEEIGRGTHERMVVDLRRLDERLAARASGETFGGTVAHPPVMPISGRHVGAAGRFEWLDAVALMQPFPLDVAAGRVD